MFQHSEKHSQYYVQVTYVVLNTKVINSCKVVSLRMVSVLNAATTCLHCLLWSPGLILVRRRDHITPALRQLHWLPVRQRVNFKLAVFVYQVLRNTTAQYLVEDLSAGLKHWSTPTTSLVSFRWQELALATGVSWLLAHGCGTVYQLICVSQTLRQDSSDVSVCARLRRIATWRDRCSPMKKNV